MNKKALLGVLFALVAVTASAEIQPMRINFQGKLINPATNNPNTSATVNLTFKLYNDPYLSGAGNLLYTEAQNNVPLNNGVFSVQIGSLTAISRDLFLGASVYLGVTVQGDSEMSPRQNLAMSAYAYSANQLSDNTEVRMIAGITYSTFTSAGNFTAPGGISGSSGTFVNGITASSGTFIWGAGGGGVFADSGTFANGITASSGTFIWGAGGGGVFADSGTFVNGITASSGVFTASGINQYSIQSSSGILMSSGTLTVNGGGGIVNQYGLWSTSATFTLNTTTWTVVSSSGIQMQAGELQIGNNNSRVIFDNPAATATSFSSNVVVVGNISAADFDWIFLASGTLAAAAATLTVNVPNPSITVAYNPPPSFMRIVILVPTGMSAAGIWQLNFNADAANDYAGQVSEALAAVTNNTTKALLAIGTASNADAGFCVLEGTVVPSLTKEFSIRCARSAGAVGAAPITILGSGFWSNVTTPITSIKLSNSGAGTFPIGTTIRVFGVQ